MNVTCLIVIPTYNEKNNIRQMVNTIIALNKGFSILIVDDNSPDGTGQIADELSRMYSCVDVIHRKQKGGLGTAYIAGFKWALKRNYQFIIQMDADFSHDPKYIPVFLDSIENCDLVIGSRYLNGISIINWKFSRLVLSLLACKYVKLITGLPFTDCLGGFKCFRRDVLESLDLDKIHSDGYVFQMEMLYIAYKKKFRIKEIQIIFKDRGFGKSKMSKRVIFEAFYKTPLIKFLTK